MNTQTTAITKDEHQSWIQELTFWSNELNFYEKVLLRLIEFPHVEEHASELEQYEDRFADMRDKLTEISGQLNNNELDASTRTKILSTENDFRILKDEFYKFSDQFDK